VEAEPAPKAKGRSKKAAVEAPSPSLKGRRGAKGASKALDAGAAPKGKKRAESDDGPKSTKRVRTALETAARMARKPARRKRAGRR
jgi:hypothetical protein